MRQDPDVIFVGEVRDEETASIAIRAAMTGHQVFTTLHTNDSVGVIARLSDIGVKPFLLSESLVCCLGQRLIRVLCPHCKKSRPADESECKLLDVDPAEGVTIYQHVGCEKCGNSGYKGRIAVSEILPISRKISEMIALNATTNAILEQANAEGFVSMARDGLDKVKKGVTDFDELMKKYRLNGDYVMPNYNYLAINENGKQFKGVMNANNNDDLEYKLGEIGLELITAKAAGTSAHFSFSSNIQNKDLILLCTHFEQLDKAGVPVAQAIEDLRDSEDKAVFRDLMQDIYESVKSGKMLSEAMAEHPKIFDEVFVGLVKAGEETGGLHQSFNYLADHLKWSEEIRRKTKKAVRYPIFLLVVVFIVTAVMMVVVIPKLSEFLLKQNFELPFYTKALIAFSEFFKDGWYIMIIVPIIFVIGNKILYRTNKGYSYFMDSLLLHLPFVGPALLKIDVARFSQFFLVTFKSGIDVIDCFDIVQRVVQNKVIKKYINEISQDVSDGSSISMALKNSGHFPTLVVRMFEVGERTGNMADSLENVKFFYDKEVNDSVDTMVGVIQPALTLLMGGLLLWISLSVFGPLYSSFSNIK